MWLLLIVLALARAETVSYCLNNPEFFNVTRYADHFIAEAYVMNYGGEVCDANSGAACATTNQVCDNGECMCYSCDPQCPAGEICQNSKCRSLPPKFLEDFTVCSLKCGPRETCVNGRCSPIKFLRYNCQGDYCDVPQNADLCALVNSVPYEDRPTCGETEVGVCKFGRICCDEGEPVCDNAVVPEPETEISCSLESDKDCDGLAGCADPDCAAFPACSCVPDCTGKVCGSDGCGGSCGTVPPSTACTIYSCSSGQIVTAEVFCDDGLECTVNSCDPITGCAFTNKADGTLCNNGNGQCSGGVCACPVAVCGSTCYDPAEACSDGTLCTNPIASGTTTTLSCVDNEVVCKPCNCSSPLEVCAEPVFAVCDPVLDCYIYESYCEVNTECPFNQSCCDNFCPFEGECLVADPEDPSPNAIFCGDCQTGTCYNANTDEQNCGGCGNVCGINEECQSGSCVALTPCTISSDCDFPNECCGSSGFCEGGGDNPETCLFPSLNCGFGTCDYTFCTYFSDDETCGTTCGGLVNCTALGQVCQANGVCGNVCAPTTCAAAGAACGIIADGCGGSLNCGTCADIGLVACPDCTDTQVDPANCGACNNVLPQDFDAYASGFGLPGHQSCDAGVAKVCEAKLGEQPQVKDFAPNTPGLVTTTLFFQDLLVAVERPTQGLPCSTLAPNTWSRLPGPFGVTRWVVGATGTGPGNPIVNYEIVREAVSTDMRAFVVPTSDDFLALFDTIAADCQNGLIAKPSFFPQCDAPHFWLHEMFVVSACLRDSLCAARRCNATHPFHDDSMGIDEGYRYVTSDGTTQCSERINNPVACGDAGTECAAGEVCKNSVCTAAPTCSDGIQNCDETDVDCGGSCSQCAATEKCLADANCLGSLECISINGTGRCLNAMNAVFTPADTEQWSNFGPESDAVLAGQLARVVAIDWTLLTEFGGTVNILTAGHAFSIRNFFASLLGGDMDAGLMVKNITISYEGGVLTAPSTSHTFALSELPETRELLGVKGAEEGAYVIYDERVGAYAALKTELENDPQFSEAELIRGLQFSFSYVYSANVSNRGCQSGSALVEGYCQPLTAPCLGDVFPPFYTCIDTSATPVTDPYLMIDDETCLVVTPFTQKRNCTETNKKCNRAILDCTDCMVDGDCPGVTDVCTPATWTCVDHCADGDLTGDETGVDCGGSCPTACPIGSTIVASFLEAGNFIHYMPADAQNVVLSGVGGGGIGVRFESDFSGTSCSGAGGAGRSIYQLPLSSVAGHALNMTIPKGARNDAFFNAVSAEDFVVFDLTAATELARAEGGGNGQDAGSVTDTNTDTGDGGTGAVGRAGGNYTTPPQDGIAGPPHYYEGGAGGRSTDLNLIDGELQFFSGQRGGAGAIVPGLVQRFSQTIQTCSSGGSSIFGSGVVVGCFGVEIDTACKEGYGWGSGAAVGGGDTIPSSAGPGFGELTYTSLCGNGVLDAGELCDDFNSVSNDGCDSDCVPTHCRDGVQNNDETGVDCGGSCPNAC